jgi:hypothetical protein
MLVRLRVQLVMVTVCEALVEPVATVPKFKEDGLAFTLACAAVPKRNTTASSAAMICILFSILAAIGIVFPFPYR